MIHVEHLHKSFGEIHAVNDISFDVYKGEVVGLLGPNGAGKTTTMRIITGYIAVDSGIVTVGGISVMDDSISVRRKIGYLPESTPLYNDMEVTSYLAYVADLRGISDVDKCARIREMVKICGLTDFVGRGIGQLSRGQRQRVGLAQALIHEPEVLILDEPTSGLDPNQILEMRKLIKEIGKERTVILSTHILQEVQATCSRALIINNGVLVGDGTLEDLMSQKSVGTHYYVTVKADRQEVEDSILQLPGLALHECFSVGDGYHRLTLSSASGDDKAEMIFDWVVSHGWKMKELTRQSASLEEVFYELTR